MGLENGVLIKQPGIHFAAAVGRALGVGDFRISYLCGNWHKRTNKWALCKPVPLKEDKPDRANADTWNQAGVITRAEKAWYRGTDRNCGLRINKHLLPELINGSLMLTTDDWDYIPPKGGSDEPYRIADFDGYWHDAPCPVAGLSVQDTVMPGQTLDVSLRWPIAPTPTSDLYHKNITLADIWVADDDWTPLSTYRFGFLLFRTTTITPGRTEEIYVGAFYEPTEFAGGIVTTPPSYAASCTIPMTYSIGDTLRILPFLAKAAVGATNDPGLYDNGWGPYILIPSPSGGYLQGESKVSTSAEAANIIVSFTARFERRQQSEFPYFESNFVDLYMSIRNENGYGYTVQDVTYTVRKNSTGESMYQDLGNIYIEGKSKWELNVSKEWPIVVDGDSFIAEFRCYLPGYGWVTRSQQVIQQTSGPGGIT